MLKEKLPVINVGVGLLKSDSKGKTSAGAASTQSRNKSIIKRSRAGGSTQNRLQDSGPSIDERKRSVYLPEDILSDVQDKAEWHGETLSRVIQDAWRYYKEYVGPHLRGTVLQPPSYYRKD